MKFSGLTLPNTDTQIRNAELPSKAAPKAANRRSNNSLHEQELKRIVVSCDGLLGNEAKVLLQILQDAPPRNQESPIPNLYTASSQGG